MKRLCQEFLCDVRYYSKIVDREDSEMSMVSLDEWQNSRVKNRSFSELLAGLPNPLQPHAPHLIRKFSFQDLIIARRTEETMAGTYLTVFALVSHDTVQHGRDCTVCYPGLPLTLLSCSYRLNTTTQV